MRPKTARLAHLPAPLTTFCIPSVSWKPDPNMMQQFQQDWCVTYTTPEEITIQFDNNLEPVIQSLIEFGIRDSRDWLFDTFNDTKEAGAGYLRLDPTNSKNIKEFEKGYEPGLDKMFPPAQDDEWWDGDFKHFDFHKLFSEIIKHAPVAMADESLEETNWVLACNGMAPNAWHEYSTERIVFFLESFVEFLKQDGVGDPCGEAEVFFHWYLGHVMEITSEMMDNEMRVVLGDRLKTDLAGSAERKAFIERLQNDSQAGEAGREAG
ncbi:hypothetical protein L208DRAFT_1378363 [Tricholoma matsutake]|nr:hypothetical protein L208DRAFT_1378363 [Tricholoma matsutake 945]